MINKPNYDKSKKMVVVSRSPKAVETQDMTLAVVSEENPLQIGKWNRMKIVKDTDFGLFLDGASQGEILLPNRYVPADVSLQEDQDVFICYDSEDRLMATTQKPLVEVGGYATLMVVSTTPVGAFLNWGLPKDLFLPFSEQTRDVKMGQSVVVYVYLDKSDRICASMRTEKYLEKGCGDLVEGQPVDLIIYSKTDLGYKAIINQKYQGMLFFSDVFQDLHYGDKLPGYIQRIREDKKIDLSLQKRGHHAADDIGQQILDLLKEEGGFLAIDDKTDAEIIYDMFGVSKKKFKMALGGLYKNRLVVIDEKGTWLPSAKRTSGK